MNYHIYYDNREYIYNFSFIDSVGDLQTVIIQCLNLSKERLLAILHDTHILGIDYLFTDSILQHNLYDTHLYVVPDPNGIGTGSKLHYTEWLSERIRGQSIMDHHRQILYHQTNNSHLSGNLNFFAQGGPVNRNVRTNQQQQQQQQRPRNPNIVNNNTNNNANNNANNNNANNSNANNNANSGVRNRNRNRANSTTALSGVTITGQSNNGNMLQNLFQDIFNNGNNQSNAFPAIIQEFMNRNDISDFGITFASMPLDNIPTGTDFFDFILNNGNFQSVPITLTRDGINRLPLFKYNQLPAEIKSDNDNICTICRDPYNDDSDIRVLLCKHYFHKNCIDQWLSEENVRCPLCRHDNREEPPRRTATHNADDIENNIETDGESSSSRRHRTRRRHHRTPTEEEKEEGGPQ